MSSTSSTVAANANADATKNPLTTTSTRTSSSSSAQIQRNLAEALGIHMPGLGNHVTISAGKGKRSGSRDSEMPLSDMIKTTISTDVKSESVPAGMVPYAGAGEREEDVEKLFSMPKVDSREGK